MTVHLRREQGVAVLTLDRPAAGNRLDPATLDALRAHLTGLGEVEDPPLVIVLASTGPDFSLGREAAAGSESPTPSGLEREFGRIQAINELVQRSPAVTIAAVQGRAFGAALSLAGRCLRLVTGH